MLILGLNAFHGDSSACIVQDGKLIAAAEEERFRRIKHWAGLPREAIQYCLREAGVRLGDADHIAINRKPGVNHFRRLGFILTHWPSPRLMASRLGNIRSAASFDEQVRAAFPGETLRAQVHHVEHHLAHLASAYLVSGFDEAVCVSVDGFGDFASVAWGMGRNSRIDMDGRVYFPHSLGIFYSAITQLLGFPWFGDEYKVMGLAPYGEPRFLNEMRQVVKVRPDGVFRLNLRCFRHHTDNVSYSWNNCSPEVGTLFTPELENLLGPARKKDEPLCQKHKDLARSAQAMYEEAFFALLNALYPRYHCPNLALSGGCAMNSVANGKVYLQTPFRKMYLPAAAGDAGGAIGAAFVVWHQVSEEQRAKGEVSSSDSTLRSSPLASRPSLNGRFVMAHAYTGPEFGDAEIEALLRSRGLISAGGARGQEQGVSPHPSFGEREEDQSEVSSSGPVQASGNQCPSVSIRGSTSEFTVTCHANSGELCRRAAHSISEGKVVGWFQGRMEWGPRALGNRSILGDPRRADMKDILNAKIKRRESFRPFAPSVLREAVSEWFEQDDDVPFMMEVFQIRTEKRKLIPAVTHVDGSGRLQTVHRETNPLYWALISAFRDLTTVPLVLNTSFNENEPVVCKPEEALDCFLRTRMDILVLGNYFVERKS